jgi:hypothetical protein
MKMEQMLFEQNLLFELKHRISNIEIRMNYFDLKLRELDNELTAMRGL